MIMATPSKSSQKVDFARLYKSTASRLYDMEGTVIVSNLELGDGRMIVGLMLYIYTSLIRTQSSSLLIRNLAHESLLAISNAQPSQ